MKTFSSTSTAIGTPKSILLIGPPGGGKTTLGLQFPKVGVVDIDRNLEGPAKRLLKLNSSFSFKHDAAYKNEKDEYVAIDQIWTNVERIVNEMLKDPEVETLLYDGLTMSDDALYENVLKEQLQKEMRRQDWVVFRAKMIRVIMKCRAVQKRFIMICHEEPQTRQDDKGNETIVKYVPSFRSKVSNFFGGFFTDMWRCYALPCSKDKTHPEGVKFCLDVLPTALSELKNSCGIPGTIEDITFEKLKPYLA